MNRSYQSNVNKKFNENLRNYPPPLIKKKKMKSNKKIKELEVKKLEYENSKLQKKFNDAINSKNEIEKKLKQNYRSNIGSKKKIKKNSKRGKVKKKYDDLEKKNKVLLDEKGKLEKDLLSRDIIIVQLNNEVRNIHESEKEKIKNILELKNQIKSFEEEINKISMTKEILDKQVETLKNQLSQKKNTQSRYEQDLEKKSSLIVKLIGICENLKEEIKDFKETQEKMQKNKEEKILREELNKQKKEIKKFKILHKNELRQNKKLGVKLSEELKKFNELISSAKEKFEYQILEKEKILREFEVKLQRLKQELCVRKEEIQCKSQIIEEDKIKIESLAEEVKTLKEGITKLRQNEEKREIFIKEFITKKIIAKKLKKNIEKAKQATKDIKLLQEKIEEFKKLEKNLKNFKDRSKELEILSKQIFEKETKKTSELELKLIKAEKIIKELLSKISSSIQTQNSPQQPPNNQQINLCLKRIKTLESMLSSQAITEERQRSKILTLEAKINEIYSFQEILQNNHQHMSDNLKDYKTEYSTRFINSHKYEEKRLEKRFKKMEEELENQAFKKGYKTALSNEKVENLKSEILKLKQNNSVKKKENETLQKKFENLKLMILEDKNIKSQNLQLKTILLQNGISEAQIESQLGSNLQITDSEADKVESLLKKNKRKNEILRDLMKALGFQDEDIEEIFEEEDESDDEEIESEMSKTMNSNFEEETDVNEMYESIKRKDTWEMTSSNNFISENDIVSD